MLSSIVDAMQYGHGALAGAALSTNTNHVLPWQFGSTEADRWDIRRSVVAIQAMGGRVLSSVCLVGGARVLSQVYTSMAAQLYAGAACQYGRRLCRQQRRKVWRRAICQTLCGRSSTTLWVGACAVLRRPYR